MPPERPCAPRGAGEAPVIRFAAALRAWGTPEFNGVLKREIEELEAARLPLQEGLTSSSHALHDRVSAMIIDAADAGTVIRAKAGIFYIGIVAGCSCADDPTPVPEQNEYCVVQLTIDKTTAETTLRLLVE
jgi:hypothetical protein